MLKEREEVKRLLAAFDRKGSLSRRERSQADALLEEFSFDPVESYERQTFLDLLSRVDEIPPSLALSQAALESAWGSSRFAREGYNLFGVWCYDPGCGMVPRRRTAGATHEVRIYESPKDSFESYIRNLNTSRFYVGMRTLRRDLRSQGKTLSGHDLAMGLTRYSQEGWDYVAKVQSLILSNKLERFD